MIDKNAIARSLSSAHQSDEELLKYCESMFAALKQQKELIESVDRVIQQQAIQNAQQIELLGHNAAVVTGGAIGKLDGSRIDTTVSCLSDISTQYIKAMYRPNPYRGICYMIWAILAFGALITIVAAMPESQPQPVEVRQ